MSLLRQTSAGTVVDFGAGDEMVLRGVRVADLVADDFVIDAGVLSAFSIEGPAADPQDQYLL